MFRVMIVDDERRTRQGIATLIDWERIGFEVIAIAADGFEAIEKYKKYSPDLILMDIRMPKMSGMETIEAIRTLDSKMKFLILSGYAEFQYAKQAIQYNVAGYLLKPVEEEELVRYLEKVKTELQEEKVNTTTKNQYPSNRFMKQVLHGNITKEVNYFFHNKWKANYYAVLLMKFFDKQQLDMADIFHIVKQHLNQENGIIFMDNKYIGVLVKENKAGNHTEKIYYPIYHALKEQGVELISVVSEIGEEVHDIATIYQKVKRMLLDSFIYEEDYMITPFTSTIKGRKIEKREFHETSLREKLFYAVEISDHSTIKKLIIEIIVLMARSNKSEIEMKQQFTTLLTHTNQQLTTHYPQVQNKIAKKLTNVVDVQQCRNVKQLIHAAHDYLIGLSSAIDGDDSDQIVKKMIYFIERNYDKSIKLDTMAELLHYHKVYLGKIFHEATGEYFKTYLDKVRMKNSKRLLLEGYKVYEVAEMVGYTTADYFHSKFKKYEGMSPSKYRKQTKNHTQIN